MDSMRMTENKLLWHMDRVEEWKLGKKIAPLHLDMGLSKGCNIKCHYCFGATQGNLFKNGQDIFVDRESIYNFIHDCSDVGVRSIAVIGEGEPLVNPHVYDTIVWGKEAGIDMSLATNGILWKDFDLSRKALSCLSWIRFNISASDQESYAQIHGSKDFDLAIENIKLVTKYKKEQGLDLTIGLQMILTSKSLDYVLPLAEIGKEIGVDYFVVKQCSDLPDNPLGYYDKKDVYKDSEFIENLKTAENMSTEDYKVIIKWPQMQSEGCRSYDSCLGAPFLLHTSGDGKIYSCAGFFDGEKSSKYLLGDYTKQRFTDILQSDQYWNTLSEVLKIDVHKDCYNSCRSNSINEFLWDFSHPPKHINFV